ncbi:RRXRR domain-containing protein [Phormidium sp. LEGE 05292]|uniref:RRXRR domain-containing protein n=1 Tax=[Phormidium] sp. LEGE 05292 TaxID=767427 RepID=UPI00187E6B49|nr:RRXRR domain-containing protein [Phormidium sp. LEGE 05292]MBE9228616.1 RRXRR domain-containing protein [Phormidium sp. LEGE 05292]
MQNYVFVLNADRVPLDQVHPARARELQSKGKAKPIRQYPYVLILQSQVENPKPKQYTLKIDPGSEWTGFAIQCGESIVFRMELKQGGSDRVSNLTLACHPCNQAKGNQDIRDFLAQKHGF